MGLARLSSPRKGVCDLRRRTLGPAWLPQEPLLAWQLAAMSVLMQIKTLGSLREVLFYSAATRVEPPLWSDDGPVVSTPLAAAVVVLVARTVAPLALGA
jgi:hypothetical protein